MRILTGKDRQRHEELLKESVRFYEQAQRYEALCKVWEQRCERWEALWKQANERAERAVDELLALRGVPPITPEPHQPLPWENPADGEDPEKVREMEERITRGDLAVFTEVR